MHLILLSNKDMKCLIDVKMFDEIEFSIWVVSSNFRPLKSPFNSQFKMADLAVVVSNKLMNSNDEMPNRGKRSNWVKRWHDGRWDIIYKIILCESWE